ncbi:MAG: FGGY-family carbohydrate kinase [Caldilineaceae bacterium]
MKKTTDFLAVDLGGSSGRVLYVRWDGERFTIGDAHRFPNISVNVLGTAHWDPLRLWTDIQEGLRKFAGQQPASIGVDTWGVDFGLLDSAGRLLGNPVCYRDTRTNGMPDRLCAAIPKREIFETIATHFIQFNTLIQLFAMRQLGDPQLDQAATLLHMPDLMNYWLTGEKRSEYTIASTSMMLDARQRQWATGILERLNLPTKILAPIVQPGTVIGPLLAAVAEETGVNPATKVIAVPSHDTASAVAAIPGLDQRSIYISSGTWCLTGVEAPEPVINDFVMQRNFTNEGGVDRTIRLLGNFTGLWLLQACQAQWQKAGENYSWDQLLHMSEVATPFRTLIYPDAPDFFNYGNMLESIRGYAHKTGQPEPDSVGAFVRCCLESLALLFRWGSEQLAAMQRIGSGAPGAASTFQGFNAVRIVGGGSQNHLLNQFTADACGLPVITGPVEATALGNAMMQAIASGHLANVAEGRQAIAASIPQEHFEPGKTQGWDEAYARFVKLF